jgi:hypothetical protein
MKITVNNVDRCLKAELSKSCTFVGITNSPNGVFIEWTTKGKTFEKQTEIIGHCVRKKIPTIIFDRNRELTDEEAGYLISKGIFLWEPAVNDRMFFSYQPVWGNIKRHLEDIPLIEKPDGIDLAYMTSLTKKVSTFQEYYQPVSEIGDFRVAFIDTVGNQPINRKVEKMGVKVCNGIPTEPVKSVILLGSDLDYQTGRLDPNLFNYLENGIVPMIPRQHRWFHSVFGEDMVVGHEDDIEYILTMYDRIAYGCIYDIYRNLDAYLPEADVKSVVTRITNYFS